MDTSKIDYVNMFLMLVAAVLAVLIPFELFLISYIFLGPLHYLTEIGWLHNKSYFLKDTSIIKVYILISTILTLTLIASKFNTTPYLGFDVNLFTTGFYPILFLFAFIAAFLYLYVEDTQLRVKLLLASLPFAYLVTKYYFIFILFGFIVPTLIHVYLFTSLFILVGAIKNKSTTAYISIIVFVLCTLLLFIDYPIQHQVSQSVQKAFLNSNFSGFANLFSSKPLPSTFDFNYPFIIKVQRFVSFAYTYHYLNWFSKTNVIKWHLAPKKFLIATILIWIFSICMYLYNYQLGFAILFFFSVLHVVLEFPLNIISIKTIFKLGKTT